MSTPDYRALPLAERYRILASAARAAITVKPWAANHFRDCASYWEAAAERADQDAAAESAGGTR